MTKMTLDNEVNNRISVIYAGNDIELSWPIKQGAIYDENDIGQWCDRSYMYDLCLKWNSIFVIDREMCNLWQKQHKTMTWQII